MDLIGAMSLPNDRGHNQHTRVLAYLSPYQVKYWRVRTAAAMKERQPLVPYVSYESYMYIAAFQNAY